MDMQELVAYCARVSNPSNQNNPETSDKLVRYLIKHKHWSPLEMVSATVEINTTRDIARQILRHRSFSFQEFSQRYADPTKELSFTPRQARMQDLKNRQNSVAITPLDGDRGLNLIDEWNSKQEELIALAKKHYVWAISQGIAKEQARSILPEGCTMSRIYMAGTLRSFVHFIEVRSANGTQAECMDIAHKIALALSPVFPMIAEFDAVQRADSQGDSK
jgi:thymidylate synthase (FAD)